MKKLTVIFIVMISVFYYSENSLAQWTPQNSGTTSVLAHIFFLNNDTGFVSTVSGGMRKTNNGGTTWTFLNSGGTHVYDFHFFSPDTGICLSDSGIYRTINGGSLWNPLLIDASLMFRYGNISYVSNGDVLSAVAATNVSPDSIEIFKSLNRGNSWTRSAFAGWGLPCVSFTSVDTGFVSLWDRVYKTIDGGTSWLNIYSNTSMSVESNYFISNDVGFLFRGYGDLLKTTDGGFSWGQVDTDGNDDVKYSMAFSNNIGFVVGGNGLSPGFILKTVNSGDNWTLNYTPSVTLTDVCFPNSNVGYACGEAGTILKYSGTVAIEENENAQPLLTTYPNPAGKQLSVSSYQSSGKSTIEIYDVLGKKVLSAQPQTSNLKLTPLTFPT